MLYSRRCLDCLMMAGDDTSACCNDWLIRYSPWQAWAQCQPYCNGVATDNRGRNHWTCSMHDSLWLQLLHKRFDFSKIIIIFAWWKPDATFRHEKAESECGQNVVDYLHYGFWTHGSVLSSWQGNMCKPTFKRKKRKTGCWIWKQKKFSKKVSKYQPFVFIS